MQQILVQGAALFGMVLIAAFFVLEARRWRAPDSLIGRRQRILRIILMAIIEALLAMMVVGPWVTSRRDPIAAVIYWSICVVLGMAVVILTLVDLREVFKGYARASRGIYRNLSGEEEDKSERR